MTAHDPRVTLTEAERRSLVEPFQRWLMDPEGVELSGVMSGSVERIIAARLAPIRALADEAGVARALYRHSGLREDLIDLCAAPVARALRAALDAPVSAYCTCGSWDGGHPGDCPAVGASQDRDGAEGQGECRCGHQSECHDPEVPGCVECRCLNYREDH